VPSEEICYDVKALTTVSAFTFVMIHAPNNKNVSVGETVPSPVVLSSPQEELCQRLDDFCAPYSLKAKPSDIFRGALFTSQHHFRDSNPDWLAQSAGSLREIIYPFCSTEVNTTPEMQEALKAFGSSKASDEKLKERMDAMWKKLNGLSHHGNGRKNDIDFSTVTNDQFDATLADFEKLMMEALTRQLDTHADADTILKAGPPA
jgi:hypothetical protein